MDLKEALIVGAAIFGAYALWRLAEGKPVLSSAATPATDLVSGTQMTTSGQLHSLVGGVRTRGLGAPVRFAMPTASAAAPPTPASFHRGSVRARARIDAPRPVQPSSPPVAFFNPSQLGGITVQGYAPPPQIGGLS